MYWTLGRELYQISHFSEACFSLNQLFKRWTWKKWLYVSVKTKYSDGFIWEQAFKGRDLEDLASVGKESW